VVELSKYEFEPLREDGAIFLYRGKSSEGQIELLVLSPLGERPLPESLKRLENEYSLKEDLDPSWAVQPISLATHWDRTVLILQDPGGTPLNCFLTLTHDSSSFVSTSASSVEALSRSASGDKCSQETSGARALAVGPALRLGISISAALGALHQRGIIHKDIKPANVLVHSASGQCWLTGFGIASRLPRERQTPGPPGVYRRYPSLYGPRTNRSHESLD
jgi:hypothetical protein